MNFWLITKNFSKVSTREALSISQWFPTCFRFLSTRSQKGSLTCNCLVLSSWNVGKTRAVYVDKVSFETKHKISDIKSLASLLFAIWLDPVIPHAAKLAQDVFELARRTHRSTANQVSVITKKSALVDCGESACFSAFIYPPIVRGSQHLDTDNRVTFNPVTCRTTLPNFSTYNQVPTTVIQGPGCTMSVVEHDELRNRKRKYDQISQLTFSNDYMPEAKKSNSDDFRITDIIDTVSWPFR